jgi:F-type H+-transporting ATPase subunit b
MGKKTVSFLLGAGAVLALQGIAWCSEGGAHDGGHGLNWFDFALRTGNFAILAFILYRLLSKPLSGFLVSRREDIQKLLADLASKKREAEEISAQYKSKLAALDEETKKIVAELLAEGETEKSKIIAAAEKQADYIRQQAQLAAQQEIKAARDKLQEEIADLSIAAAEEILRKNLKADDQDRLVKDFMKRVVEAK